MIGIIIINILDTRFILIVFWHHTELYAGKIGLHVYIFFTVFAYIFIVDVIISDHAASYTVIEDLYSI